MIARRLQLSAALVAALLSATCACSGERAPNAVAPSSFGTSPSPSPSPSASPSAPAPAPAPKQPAALACPPWLDAASLTASSQAGRADFRREFHYDLRTGALRVHDSDPFWSGKAEGSPRVIQESKTLTADERDRLERALHALCPTPEAMARRCAPGGCMRLSVEDASGKATRIEDAETVRAVMKQLAPHFPQLRTQ